MVSGLLGADTDNNVTYQAFTPLVVLTLLAFGFSWIFRARFSAQRFLPRFATAGAPMSYKLTMRNLTTKSQRGLTLLEDMADPRPQFPEWLAAQLADEKKLRSLRFGRRTVAHPFRPATLKEAEVPSIPPNREVDVQVELTPLRRGILRFNGLTIARSDPFGLCRAFARLPLPQSMLVLPKRYPLPTIALPGSMKYQQGGVALASNVGRSDEFVSLRDYRRGDPPRNIHWRSWARAGKPVVKEFEDEFFVRHALVLDTFVEHPRSQEFEEAVSVAASFACALQTQESLLDLLFVGPQSFCFTSGRGLAHSDQMLQILASVEVCREKPFKTLEHLVMNHVRSVSGCICVLLAWDDERWAFVEKLQALMVPLLVLLIVEPGKAEGIDPGPMKGARDKFHVLETGHIQEGLAKLT
jgi:uncharacterized protein (DUF58 family)